MLPGRGLSARRGLWAAVVAVILGGTLAYPVAGQPETFELHLKLEQGETLYYTYSSSLSDQMADRQRTTETREEGRLTLRVLDVDLDGIMSVESVIEDLRVATDGRTEDKVGSPAVFRIRPDGTLVEPEGSKEPSPPPAWVSTFPGHPVSVGESWSSHISVPLQVFAMDLNPTFTLTGVDQAGDGRAAHVQTRVEGTMKSAGLSFPPPLVGGMQAQVQAKGTVHGSGEEVWSVERGRLLRSEYQETIDMHVQMTVAGHTTVSSDTTHVRTHLETLSPDKVAAPSVGADALIVPGGAIGPFALDRGMSALVYKLGAPYNGASVPDKTMWGGDRGFRSTERTWRNGLVAYLDWDDPSKLLGLGVADRLFRTDKGIGFGSSAGAVLFGYGMSPERLDMTSNLGLPGAVTVLVYDPQGIAFAIVTESDRSTFGLHRAPVGTVAWIVVFPPGSAGKIFPLQ